VVVGVTAGQEGLGHADHLAEVRDRPGEEPGSLDVLNR
jgi:hypothetical protein